MKNLTVVLSILCIGFFTVSCKESATDKIKKENVEIAEQRDAKIKVGGPTITFDRIEHDFGIINEGDIVETVFSFTNTGKSELIISSAKGSCGCTVPEWPKAPVMPGETGDIKVKFNSDKKPNKQQKTVTLVTNTENGQEILVIKAQVTPKSK